MKRFSRKSKNRIKTLTLCAAMVFTLAADSVVRPFNASASEEEAASEEIDAEISSDILKGDFGYVEFWRWERVDSNSYPRDNDWVMSLFFFGDYSVPIRDGRLFSAAAPGAIAIGPSADPISGVTNVITNTDGSTYYTYFVSDADDHWGDQIREQYAHYVKLDKQYCDPSSYRKYGASPNKDVFFTTSDMNPVYVKYTGTNDNVNGVNGQKAPMYKIKLTSTTDTDYYLTATDKSKESLPQIVTNENSAKSWTFRSKDYGHSSNEQSYNYALDIMKDGSMFALYRHYLGLAENVDADTFAEAITTLKYGTTYTPVIFDKGNDDEVLVTRNTGYVFTADDVDTGMMCDHTKWYVGKRYLFSALKGTTTIRNGQILSITANDYIDAEGNAESQNGVILKNGDKLVVEKGGILSIEGNLINNGTIENRGGTIIVKDGGCIFPFQQGSDVNKNGCGAIKCIGGDIIIQKGGTVYGGLSDTNGAQVPFWLDEGSVLMNQGLLIYGNMKLGNGVRVELYENSKTYGAFGTQKSVAGEEIEARATGANWYAIDQNGQMTSLYDFLYLNRVDFAEDLYYDYNKENFPDKSFEEQQAFANRVAAAATAANHKITVEYKTTYQTANGLIFNSKEECIASFERLGYSLIGEDSKGSMTFSLFSYDGNFNEMLTVNNTAFTNGTLTNLKFLKQSSGLLGMNRQRGTTKRPVLLKVDSASLVDDSMITDTNSDAGIEVGKLTI